MKRAYARGYSLMEKPLSGLVICYSPPRMEPQGCERPAYARGYDVTCLRQTTAWQARRRDRGAARLTACRPRQRAN